MSLVCAPLRDRIDNPMLTSSQAPPDISMIPRGLSMLPTAPMASSVIPAAQSLLSSSRNRQTTRMTP